MTRHLTSHLAAVAASAALLLAAAPVHAANPGPSEDKSAGTSTETLVVRASSKAVKVAALTPAAAARLHPALATGASSPAVVYLQRKLGVTPISGYYGPITTAAVRRLQKQHKLAGTGQMNKATWKLVIAASTRSAKSSTARAIPARSTLTPKQAAAKRPLLQFGAGPDDPAVIYLQDYLGVSPQSGYFGAMTREAVKAYQTGMGIRASGVVGPLTWEAIRSGKKVQATPNAVADPEAPALNTAAEGGEATPAATSTPAAAVTVVEAGATRSGQTVTATTGQLALSFSLSATPTAGERALAYALAQVGKPYVLGGNGPDVFDCSGLVQQAYLSAGIALPRLASTQIDVGTRVTLEQLVPGDLLYYQSNASPRSGHISMYAGNGLAVEAANPRRGVRLRPLNESWYAERFVAATRIG
ncbi:MAG: NlpC/P60 family protein [Candidatus Nanopelagicales bacterium]